MATLKDQLETAQSEILRLTGEADTKDTKISELEEQLKPAPKPEPDEDDKNKGKDGKDMPMKGKKAKADEPAPAATAAPTATVSVGVEVVDVNELKTNLETAQRDLKNSNARVKQLEDEHKTVDETAEVKAREIAARAGTALPAKAHNTGDQTTEKKVDASMPWRQRLGAFWKPIALATDS
jgi:hypothetical protein